MGHTDPIALTPYRTVNAADWRIPAAGPADLVLRQSSVTGLAVGKHLLHREKTCATVALTPDSHVP